MFEDIAQIMISNPDVRGKESHENSNVETLNYIISSISAVGCIPDTFLRPSVCLRVVVFHLLCLVALCVAQVAVALSLVQRTSRPSVRVLGAAAIYIVTVVGFVIIEFRSQ